MGRGSEFRKTYQSHPLRRPVGYLRASLLKMNWVR
jgi:hypothetical protein